MFDKIATSLKGLQRKEMPAEGLVEAAVLVPLFEKEGKLQFLMGRRTDLVETHKRQISFPGGAKDPADKDSVETALREAQEEIGLEPGDVEILGILNDIKTITGFRVTPVVGSIPYPYAFSLNETEVEELIEVPWVVFSERRGHRTEYMEYEGERREVDFYRYEEHVIWGATARITRQLVELVEQ